MSTLVWKRSTVSPDLTADIVCRILQEEITDDRVQRLKAVGEHFNYNFQNGDVANYTIDKHALHENQAVLRRLFNISTVFPKVVLQRSIEKYDKQTGVCIRSCREDAYILKRMQMECRFLCCLDSQSLQVDRPEHEVRGLGFLIGCMSWASWPTDWQGCHLRRLEKASLNVSAVRWSFVQFHILVLLMLTPLLGEETCRGHNRFRQLFTGVKVALPHWS